MRFTLLAKAALLAVALGVFAITPALAGQQMAWNEQGAASIPPGNG